MDLSRLRALVAAPLASLFLVLVLCTFEVRRPVSAGIHVPITRVRTDPIDSCEGVDRWIVVLLHKDGSAWINEAPVPAGELRSRLAEIYENRKYKLIYMFSDPDVSFGEFANFYNTVASSTSDLQIGLRTRKLEAQLERCPLGSSCGLEWPDHTYIPCVERQILLRPVRIQRHLAR
jgi:biopolymer transport protein ExbD